MSDVAGDNIVVTKVTDVGDDVLVVEAVVNGETVTATGWVSAMTNHYDAKSYAADGHRDPKAQPRAMTDDERHDYWRSLFVEQASVETVLYESETP